MPTSLATKSRKRLDLASLALMLVGIVFGVLSVWLVATRALSVAVVVPSVVATVVGATHLVKLEAPRV